MAKGKAEVLPLEAQDIPGLIPIIRQADLDEIEGGLGIPMASALRQCIAGSMKAQKIVARGKVVAVFGDSVHSLLDGIGVPWLISTVHVDRHPLEFLRVCKPEVRDMLTRHRRLVNYVDARNKAAIRWLRWLGFRFGKEPVPYGPHGLPFYAFELIREV